MSNLSRFITHWVTLMLVATLLMACGGKETRKAAYMERGKAYFEEKNFGKANIEFRNVIQIDPKTAEAVYFVGLIAEQQKNWMKAFKNYRQASLLDENLVGPRVQLARIYMSQAGALQARGDTTGKANALGLAQEHITKILDIEPDNVEAKTLAAVMRSDSGELEASKKDLEEIVKLHPEQRSAVIVLSRMHEDAGDFDKAEEVLKSALVDENEGTDLKISLVQFYVRQKNMVEVEKILRQLMSENPDSDLFRNALVGSLAKDGRLNEAEQILRDRSNDDLQDVKRYLALSRFLESQGDEAGALNELKQVIAKKPELVEVSFALAALHIRAGDTEAAKNLMEAVIKQHGLKPMALKARTIIARMLITEDQNSGRANKLIETVLKENPSDNAALQLSGRIAALRGDYTRAIADFRAVLKDQPDSVEVIKLLAAAHAANNEPRLAREMLVMGIGKNPQDTDLRLSMAGVLIRENDIDRALEEIEKILVIDKFHDKALAVKFQLLAQKGDVSGLDQVAEQMQAGDPDDDTGFFREVQIRVAQREYDAALEILDEVLSKKPDSIPALLAKSHVLDKQKKYDEALIVVRHFQKVLPDAGEGYYREAKLLEKKGELKAALKQYEVAFDKQGISEVVNNRQGGTISVILLAMAEVEVKMGNRDSAERRVKEVIAIDANHKTAYDVLGSLYFSERKFAEAEQAFESQLKNAPNSRVTYSQLASARTAQKNIEGAVQAYQAGLVLFENDTLMMIGFAGLRERQGYHEDAIGLYERVLEQQPGNAISINNLASLLADFRADAKSMERAIELANILEKTSQPAFRDTAGWIYHLQGDNQHAAEILQKVVDEQPDVPVFNYHLGMALLKEGDKAAAKNYLKKATGKNAKYIGVNNARNALDAL